jgi:NTE family protein
MTVVEAETGRFTVFDRDSGVDPVHAVAASCAVPFVWAPVKINGRHYTDGGMRAATNADLATGADTVVAITPTTRGTTRATSVAAQLATTCATRTVVVTPDRAAAAAMGRNPLDTARRRPSAEAGLRQASAVASTLGDWPA